MMRVIKFRSWEMYEDTLDKECWCMEYQGDQPFYKFFSMYGANEPDSILMQYIGIKDKNDREIYEGDILEHCERFFEIKYCRAGADDMLGFHPVDKNGEHMSEFYGGWHGYDVEIIGNIYETIKEGKE